jgi:hypothetical protein
MLSDKESDRLFEQYVSYINTITEVTEYHINKIETYLGLFYFANRSTKLKLAQFNKNIGL